MLYRNLKKDEKIVFYLGNGREVIVEVSKLLGRAVKLGIDCPKEVEFYFDHKEE